MAFLITGLPRSRTAWLSAFLTDSGAYCLHEGLLLGEDRLVDWLNASELHGDSDSGLPLVWKSILEKVQSIRVVIVERNAEEVCTSLTQFWKDIPVLADIPPEPVVSLIKTQLETIKPQALVVSYESLSNPEILRTIWEFCIPSIPFDPLRTELLLKLNIQQCTKSFSLF